VIARETSVDILFHDFLWMEPCLLLFTLNTSRGRCYASVRVVFHGIFYPSRYLFEIFLGQCLYFSVSTHKQCRLSQNTQ
jgi:hypothetical protein